MKLNSVDFLKSRYCDVDNQDDYEPENYNLPLYNLSNKIIEIISKHIQNLDLETKKSLEPEHLDFILSSKEYSELDSKNIDIILFSDKNNMQNIFECSDNILGLFILINPDTWDYNEKLELCMHLDYNYLLNHCIEERFKEMSPSDNSYDEEYLFTYFTTLTHELSHILDYVENVGGFFSPRTSNEICEDLEIDTRQLIFGLFNRPENKSRLSLCTNQLENDEITPSEYNALIESFMESTLEERVEKRGELILKKCWQDIVKSSEYMIFLESIQSDLNYQISYKF